MLQELLLVLLLCLIPCITARHVAPVCQRSKYACSCEDGIKRGYSGYLDEAHEIKEALRVAAYKKEARRSHTPCVGYAFKPQTNYTSQGWALTRCHKH